MTDIRSSWVDSVTTQSRVLTLGHGVEDSLTTLDGQKLIVVIPGACFSFLSTSIALAGNPGMGAMYQDFMRVLSECLDDARLSIWSFSYVGHDTQTPPTLPTGLLSQTPWVSVWAGYLDKTKLINYLSAPTYDLEDQIEHKIALLKKLVPRTTQLTLIGHSIGCKICMEIFKRNNSHTIRGLKSHRACNETSYYTDGLRCVFPLPHDREHGDHWQGEAGAPMGHLLQTPSCGSHVCSEPHSRWFILQFFILMYSISRLPAESFVENEIQ